MFKREVFNRIGMYDERLVRNQDDEFCFRLRLNGGKIYISPVIVSEYYVRDSPGKLFRQYFDYGKWRIAVLRKHKIPIAFRQFVPALFFSGIIAAALLSSFIGKPSLGVILPGVYVALLIVSSVKVLLRSGVSIAASFFIAVFILHFSYASGFIAAFFSSEIKSIKSDN
jgi:hypothetical protein